ncbi:hypothetical protein LPB140_04675 [Sphingorhabdus lutea]|uniref:DUF3829 domain-containing protein n=1 Tax=Sphingorhabdus lutea TaxID=1913578 RepID=A0A1L3JAY2_9SPHN|nr:hypothetical protein [Sphingorhabdus lutea]APG62213.1 hypothetical protein LPB140_04675 [Sphingorhabdus lutea]
MKNVILKSSGLMISVLAIAACAPVKPVATTPVAIPPAAVVIPPRPIAPAGSYAGMTIPPLDADGTRSSPNKNLTPDEIIWNLRSAYTVAAVGCRGGANENFTALYNEFIKKHSKYMAGISKNIDKVYQSRIPGNAGLRARDTDMTNLYNYFSLPSVSDPFCDKMLAVAYDWQSLPATQFEAYSIAKLPEVDAIFTGFYDSYVAYERALAEWRMKYEPNSADGVTTAAGASSTGL